MSPGPHGPGMAQRAATEGPGRITLPPPKASTLEGGERLLGHQALKSPWSQEPSHG